MQGSTHPCGAKWWSRPTRALSERHGYLVRFWRGPHRRDRPRPSTRLCDPGRCAMWTGLTGQQDSRPLSCGQKGTKHVTQTLGSLGSRFQRQQRRTGAWGANLWVLGPWTTNPGVTTGVNASAGLGDFRLLIFPVIHRPTLLILPLPLLLPLARREGTKAH